MIKKLKMILLKLVFTKEERCFISSGLNNGLERYKERFNDVNCDSYHSEPLKRNIPKLIILNELFNKSIKSKEY